MDVDPNVVLNGNSIEQNLIQKLIDKSQKLKFVLEEQRKLSLIKEHAELQKKINELFDELREQEDKIMQAASTSETVKKNIETLSAAMEECLEYFDELNNTTVIFITKPKLKRKALAVTQSLRSKATQLLTSVTLELLLSQNNPEPPAPIVKKVPLSDDPLSDAQEYCLYYYGLGGRAVNYSRAYDLATKAAMDEEHPRAMLILAKCLLNGHGVDIDVPAAQAWLEKASDMGFMEAKIELAISLLNSIKNRKESCARKLANNSNTDGANQIKSSSLTGIGLITMSVIQLEKDRREDDKLLEKATELLIAASDNDYAVADTYLGIIEEESGDYKEAAEFFTAGTRRGCADSMNRLGLLHYFGRGVPKAHDKAYALFNSAATAGNRDAYNNVGMCWENGEGTEKSIADALKHYEIGAKLGCPDSMYSLGYLYVKRYIGTMQSALNSSASSTSMDISFSEFQELSYYDSQAVDGRYSHRLSLQSTAPRLSSKDKEDLNRVAREGMRWLRQASEQGIIEAAYQLGRVYQQGIGVPTDMNAAFMQFESAALQGHAAAAEIAADMKYAGIGTLQDNVEAAKFYRIAAEKSRPKSMNSLGLLLESGDGVLNRQPQIDEACTWFLEATRKGLPEAAISLATILGRLSTRITTVRTLNGESISRDVVKRYLMEEVTVTARHSTAFERALNGLDPHFIAADTSENEIGVLSLENSNL